VDRLGSSAGDAVQSFTGPVYRRRSLQRLAASRQVLPREKERRLVDHRRLLWWISGFVAAVVVQPPSLRMGSRSFNRALVLTGGREREQKGIKDYNIIK
jgi:hypothetical protein